MSNTRRVAIVTGAGRGIGAATATRLAGNGLAVGVLDRDAVLAEETAAKIVANDGEAIAVTVDVSVPAEIGVAVREVAERLGDPTVLVNNAGITRDGPLEEISLDDWEQVVNVNLRGTFLMCQAVLPYQRAAGWGRIVNVSSGAALGTRNQANYCAAKAGLHGLTKSMAIELGPDGITANVVAPGYIVSDMTTSAADRLGVRFETITKVVSAQTPVRRVGQPEDIANTIVHLAGEDAGFLTGQIIMITGGLVG